jgi:hypothetical protein
MASMLQELELTSVFNVKLNIPNVRQKEEVLNILKDYTIDEEDKNQVKIHFYYRLPTQLRISQLKSFF